MSNGYPAVGHILVNEAFHFLQITDATTNEIDLSVAAHFEVDGIRNDFMTEGRQFCLDGIAVGRWSAYDAHVARSHERELQCARNRRSRHRERVDVSLELTKFFLCCNAKLLLLINNKQSEVVPLHGLADEFVGADENIYFPCRQVVQNLMRLFGRT